MFERFIPSGLVGGSQFHRRAPAGDGGDNLPKLNTKAIGGTTNANGARGSGPNPLPRLFSFVRSLREREGSKDTVAIITLDNLRGRSRATLIPGNLLPKESNNCTNHCPLVMHERKKPQITSKKDLCSPFLPPPADNIKSTKIQRAAAQPLTLELPGWCPM